MRSDLIVRVLPSFFTIDPVTRSPFLSVTWSARMFEVKNRLITERAINGSELDDINSIFANSKRTHASLYSQIRRFRQCSRYKDNSRRGNVRSFTRLLAPI